jgi:hypothetical protein
MSIMLADDPVSERDRQRWDVLEPPAGLPSQMLMESRG